MKNNGWFIIVILCFCACATTKPANYLITPKASGTEPKNSQVAAPTLPLRKEILRLEELKRQLGEIQESQQQHEIDEQEISKLIKIIREILYMLSDLYATR